MHTLNYHDTLQVNFTPKQKSRMLPISLIQHKLLAHPKVT